MSDKPHRLEAGALRWRVDETQLAFVSTAEVNPAESIVGQPVAIEAMRFGVEMRRPRAEHLCARA